jgi:hypothetical protein
MKERPTNLKAWEIRAILDGRKTQTRRVVKPQPSEGLSWRGVISCATIKADEGKHLFTDCYPCARQTQRIRCPYGQPGDRLWVRETWAPHADTPRYAIYRCDPGGDYQDNSDGFRWRPSIHMPRTMSRITLEIESVRVERLNEINNSDAKAEGLPSASPHRHGSQGIVKDDCPPDPYARRHYTGINDCWICAFRMLWQSINGPGSWDANPWVWVVTFRRV